MPYNYVSNQASEPHIPSPASPGHYFPCTRHTLIHMHTRTHKYIIHKDSYTGMNVWRQMCIPARAHTRARVHSTHMHSMFSPYAPLLPFHVGGKLGF